MLRQTAQSGEFDDLTIGVLRPGMNHPSAQTAMRTLMVVPFQIFPCAVFQLTGRSENDVIRAFALITLHEGFHKS